MNKLKISVIGAIPPPIGGVTIHVQRLIEHLNKSDIAYEFIDFKKSNKIKLLRNIFCSHSVHLHTSNPLFRLIIILLCRLLGKKIIFTLHGNLDRFNIIKNKIDRMSIWLATVPILINKKSYLIASKINPESKLLSAFLLPAKIEEISAYFKNKIQIIKRDTNELFCTNAYNVSFDNNNQEIYQISSLVSLFNKMPDKGLIISDPSGNYLKFLNNNGIAINANVLIIPIIHDFNYIILQSDCFIRFTTTDGDSLSVKEALSLGKQVIATDVVDRPKQVTLVSNNIESLKNEVLNFEKSREVEFSEDGFSQLKEIYNYILQ